MHSFDYHSSDSTSPSPSTTMTTTPNLRLFPIIFQIKPKCIIWYSNTPQSDSTSPRRPYLMLLSHVLQGNGTTCCLSNTPWVFSSLGAVQAFLFAWKSFFPLNFFHLTLKRSSSSFYSCLRCCLLHELFPDSLSPPDENISPSLSHNSGDFCALLPK